MNKSLESILEQEYQQDKQWQAENSRLAKEAKQQGDMVEYLELAVPSRLPDTCWALERWEEAFRWYRHNAAILQQRREYHARHTPGFPMEIHLRDEAITLVRAGCLAAGRARLEEALARWTKEENSRLIVARLGLHAAQAGVQELAHHALAIIAARQELPGPTEGAAAAIREQLHYEPAQLALFAGDWQAVGAAVERLEAAAGQLTRPVFPEQLQEAILEAGRGLRGLLALHAGQGDRQQNHTEARRAFEAAMLHFYQFAGYNDVNVYMMRLNTRFASELARGEAINPNPFAQEPCAGGADDDQLQ